MADSGSGDPSGQRVPTPGGSAVGLLMGRRPSATISPGRLPSMRSRDLTLGGVKKVMSLLQRILEIVQKHLKSQPLLVNAYTIPHILTE